MTRKKHTNILSDYFRVVKLWVILKFLFKTVQ